MIVFSGSFDPFHLGHEAIVKYLLNKYKDDIGVLVQMNRFKRNQSRFKLTDRINAIKHLYKEEPRVTVFEGDITTKKYFIDSLKQLNKIYHDIKLVMGDDTFNKMHEWKNYQEVIKIIPKENYIIFNRDKSGFIEAKLPKLSSSDLKKCDDIMREKIPKRIWNYFVFNELVTDYWRSANATDIILIHDNKILLTKRTSSDLKYNWVLPGGHLDFEDYNLEEAAKRELLEETGIKVKSLNQFRTYSNADRDIRKRVISTVFYKQLLLKPQLFINEEVSEFKWLPFDKINEINLGADHNQILKDFIRFYNNIK